MSIVDYPTKECYVCKGSTWWFRAGTGFGEWVCGICFPPPTELETLKMRIRKGNYLWTQVRWYSDESINEPRIIEMMNRLTALGKQLKTLSTDCLYFENKKKMKKCMTHPGQLECFTCPNDYWFQTELFDIDKKNFPEAYK